jgi:hypothetical protein
VGEEELPHTKSALYLISDEVHLGWKIAGMGPVQ